VQPSARLRAPGESERISESRIASACSFASMILHMNDEEGGAMYGTVGQAIWSAFDVSPQPATGGGGVGFGCHVHDPPALSSCFALNSVTSNVWNVWLRVTCTQS